MSSVVRQLILLRVSDVTTFNGLIDPYRFMFYVRFSCIISLLVNNAVDVLVRLTRSGNHTFA